nr:unnamed protein product [Spirometra erinaceieuropaei]
MARPQDTALARLYALLKVHKVDASLRPIVSLKETPTYGLAKRLFRRLNFLTAESETTVSSSAQFLEKLKGDLPIETIELLLQSKYDETENRLGHTQVLQLLKLCLMTYFTFDGTFCEQAKGTTMGSPISGFIAEAVVQRLESLSFQHDRPKFWARYVNDTFVVIERDQVLTFQEHLNGIFRDIQFTMEEEENNQRAFLDVLVHKVDASLRPIVSLKETPTYGLTKRLFRRLNFLTAESDTTVSSSAQFLEKLKGDLPIETIELLLQSKYDETENRLGHTQVLQLLKLCLMMYFTFDGKFCEQAKGTTMGSPISGFIAEAVVQRLESLRFQHDRPKFWARYLNDTFVVIERDQVLTFQEHLNGIFRDIQFTMEEEGNNQRALLDVLVCRKNLLC